MDMQLMRRERPWNPLREMEQLADRMNRLFDFPRADGEREWLASTDWSPNCDISETDKEYRINTELPGVKRDDVKVTLEEGVLTLTGERKQQSEEKNERFHRRESSYGSFMRRFTLPSDADPSNVQAKFQDGVLEVRIPRTRQAPPQTKQIKIQ